MNQFSFVMPFGLAVFWGVITLSILVVLHEGGHFLASRLFGVDVHEFMIGLPGPALRFRPKRGKTSYGITAIPLGGYVRIAGMEPGTEDELLASALAAVVDRGPMSAETLARDLGVDEERSVALLTTLVDYMAVRESGVSDEYEPLMSREPGETPEAMLARRRRHVYRGLPTWKRVVVLVSGVGVNIVAAILTFTIVLSLYGFLVPTLTIESVQPKSPAAVAGIKPGDEVTAIDGQRLAGWTELTSALAKRKPGETVTLAYRRGGVAMASTLVLATREDGSALIGIVSHSVNRPESPITAFVDSLKLTGAVFAAIAAFFGSVIHPHQFVQQLQGARSVIGISTMVRDAAETGPLDYAWLVALLSLSLGAMNVLPIPPLDGGKIALEIIERIAGRPIKREIAYAVSAVGVALLFSLIGYLMYADIVRLVTNKG